uniref:Uncharacterized protein n=1 Tax=Knipowitschia caucasica TaxID=637954 RepID=A0AAV2JUP8_KNICA
MSVRPVLQATSNKSVAFYQSTRLEPIKSVLMLPRDGAKPPDTLPLSPSPRLSPSVEPALSARCADGPDDTFGFVLDAPYE